MASFTLLLSSVLAGPLLLPLGPGLSRHEVTRPVEVLRRWPPVRLRQVRLVVVLLLVVREVVLTPSQHILRHFVPLQNHARVV